MNVNPDIIPRNHCI